MFISSYRKHYLRVVQWLYVVIRELEIPKNILYPTARLFYNYKSLTNVSIPKLQREGIACLLVCNSVHVDGYTEDLVQILCRMSVNSFSSEELLITTEELIRSLPEEIGRFNPAYDTQHWYFGMLILSSIESWNYSEADILEQIRLLEEGRCSYEFFQRAYESEQLYCKEYDTIQVLVPWITTTSTTLEYEKNAQESIPSIRREEGWRNGVWSIVSQTTNSIVYKVKTDKDAVIVKKNHEIAIGIREIVFYSILQHENIMTLLDFDLLKARSFHPIGECCKIFSKKDIDSLVSAVSYLHGKGIVHRDIKASNIVFVEGIPKLIDFGSMSYSAYSYSHEESTSRYLPPECLNNGRLIPYTKASDVWSLGVTILEFLLGYYPFNRYENTPSVAEIVIILAKLKNEDKIPYVAQRMLELDPAKRLEL